MTGTADEPGTAVNVPAIRIRQLTKRFGQALVRRGIDLTVPRGEVVSIIGRSGSGESTLIRCINLLGQPTMGSVEALGNRLFDQAHFTISKRDLLLFRARVSAP